MPRVSTFCPRCGESIETEVPEEARTAGRAALACPSCRFAFEIAPAQRPTAPNTGSGGWSRVGESQPAAPEPRPDASTPPPPQVTGWAPAGRASDAAPRSYKPVVAAMLLFFAAVVGLWMGSTVVFQDEPLRTALDTMEGDGDLTGIVTAGGDPVSNVTVTLLEPSGNETPGPVTTDTNGRYSFGSVEPGVYVLEFRADGYETVELETFVAGSDLADLVALGSFMSIEMDAGEPEVVDERSKVEEMERVIRGFGVWFIVASVLAGAGAVAATMRKAYPLAVIGSVGGVLSYGLLVGTIASVVALVLIVLARKEFARRRPKEATGGA